MKNNEKRIKRQRILKVLNVTLTMICVVCLMGSGVVFAASSHVSNVLSIKNVFQTDKVNIDLKTMSKSDNENDLQELKDINNINIEPGGVISYIPTITNLGSDAYIRAYLHIPEESGLDIDDLKGFSEKWKYVDGYYYYQDVVKKNDEITLCHQIEIPADYSHTNANIDVKVTVDAIQSRNFNPNFNSAHPWGTVEIKKYENTGVYQYQKSNSKSNDVHITYNGKSNELVTNQDDFFVDMPTLVPGDTYENDLTVTNDYDSEARLYFEAHPSDDIEIPNDLLKEISLVITSDDGKEIYNGDLSQDIENHVVLELKAHQTRKLHYKVELDKNADNAYTNLDNLVNWYFNTQFASKKLPPEKEDSKGDKKPEKDNTPKKEDTSTQPKTMTEEDTKKPVNDVKTGDDTQMSTCMTLLVAGIVSGVCALYLNHSRKV